MQIGWWPTYIFDCLSRLKPTLLSTAKPIGLEKKSSFEDVLKVVIAVNNLERRREGRWSNPENKKILEDDVTGNIEPV